MIPNKRPGTVEALFSSSIDSNIERQVKNKHPLFKSPAADKRMLDMNWKQAKRAKPFLKPYGDYDFDGTINKDDCKPFDPARDGIGSFLRKVRRTVRRTARKVYSGAKKVVKAVTKAATTKSSGTGRTSLTSNRQTSRAASSRSSRSSGGGSSRSSSSSSSKYTGGSAGIGPSKPISKPKVGVVTKTSKKTGITTTGSRSSRGTSYSGSAGGSTSGSGGVTSGGTSYKGSRSGTQVDTSGDSNFRRVAALTDKGPVNLYKEEERTDPFTSMEIQEIQDKVDDYSGFKGEYDSKFKRAERDIKSARESIGRGRKVWTDEIARLRGLSPRLAQLTKSQLYGGQILKSGTGTIRGKKRTGRLIQRIDIKHRPGLVKLKKKQRQKFKKRQDELITDVEGKQSDWIRDVANPAELNINKAGGKLKSQKEFYKKRKKQYQDYNKWARNTVANMKAWNEQHHGGTPLYVEIDSDTSVPFVPPKEILGYSSENVEAPVITEAPTTPGEAPSYSAPTIHNVFSPTITSAAITDIQQPKPTTPSGDGGTSRINDEQNRIAKHIIEKNKPASDSDDVIHEGEISLGGKTYSYNWVPDKTGVPGHQIGWVEEQEKPYTPPPEDVIKISGLAKTPRPTFSEPGRQSIPGIDISSPSGVSASVQQQNIDPFQRDLMTTSRTARRPVKKVEKPKKVKTFRHKGFMMLARKGEKPWMKGKGKFGKKKIYGGEEQSEFGEMSKARLAKEFIWGGDKPVARRGARRPVRQKPIQKPKNIKYKTKTKTNRGLGNGLVFGGATTKRAKSIW